MFLFSYACAIPDGDSVVLTGGMFTENKVSRYQMDQGWVEDLPDLKFGRVYHGCAAFTKDDKQVRKNVIEGKLYPTLTSGLSCGWRSGSL